MGKKLSDMTLNELWHIFPISLCAPQENWKKQYNAEYLLLKGRLPDTKIFHIGSTAIGTIWAKPIVDILVEIKEDGFETAHKAITDCGYTCMNTEKHRRDYNKGYTAAGFAKEVFHLHLRITGDNDELYFRDYLIEHGDAAKQYEALKLKLWKKYEFDRDGYTEAKSEFIEKCTKKAKKEFGTRYESRSVLTDENKKPRTV